VDAWTLIRFLHVVALAFFLGGQIMLVAVVVPAVRRGGDDAAMRAVARRFGIGSAVALVVLIATGVALAEHFGRWDDSTLHAKLALLVLIGVLTGVHIARPGDRALSVALFLTTVAIVWLGVDLAHRAS
jgi:uncharacterized membrane protein